MRYSTLSSNPNPSTGRDLKDLRDWELRNGGDDKLGTVKDVLIDDGGQARYALVDVGWLLNPHHVLIPLRAVELDDERRALIMDGVTKDELKRLPEYSDQGAVGDSYDREFRESMAASASGRTADAEGTSDMQADAETGREVHVQRVEEELAVGKRRVQAGEVDVHKTVETEHVRQAVPTMHEEVEIERRPVREGTPDKGEVAEDEVRVPLMAEELVVEKRPVVKEEVVVRKRAVEDTKTAEADLRKERIDVERQGRRAGEARSDSDRGQPGAR